MEEKILDILKQVFELTEIDCTCSQKTCEAWDSIHHLDLVVELESEFDIALEPEEIADMKSYDDLVRLVSSKTKN
jgi:acyl carrier protein